MSSKSWIKKIILISMVLLVVLSLSYVVYASQTAYTGADVIPLDASILDDTFLASNEFTQEDDLSVVDNYLDVPSSYILVGSNDYYSLYMEEGSYAIRVVNKEDGFIYGSSLSTKDDNLENFNTTWEGIVNSAVTIKYYSYNDTTGVYTSMEESFLKSENSHSSYELRSDGFIAHLYFGESGISLDLVVYLDEDYLVVEVPNDSIQESSDYQLRSIKTYPFLGSVYGDSVPGYVLVPDGSGALIRYQAIDVLTDIYEFRYYGQDNSIQAELDNEATLSFPVSGMIQGINQHGFIAIVEDGATFASLVVSPAKRNLKYYYSYNEFLYRSLYQTPLSEADATNASGRLITEENINSCNIVLKYHFLSGEDANYVGMANAYQDYLLSASLMKDRVTDEATVRVFFEVIGSEMKEGFIFNEYLKLTTYQELNDILMAMDEKGIDLMISYKGFTRDGATSSPLVIDSLRSKLGSVQELKALIATAASLGSELYLFTDPMRVYSDASFSIYKDIARRINQNLLTSDGLTKEQYFASPETVVRSMLESVSYLKKEKVSSVVFGSLGNTIYSDYSNETNPVDRSEALSRYVEALSSIKDMNLLMYQSNLYTLNYTSSYLLMPTASSRFRIYSDSVPFVPYVLSGILDKYSRFQNFSSASKTELLKMVDYGIYPSYIITSESAYLLQDTELKQIYSSSFATWESEIISNYQFVEEALKEVVNQQVVSRERIQLGVYKVTYSNQTEIYINYTSNDVHVAAGNIGAQGYLVVIQDA